MRPTCISISLANCGKNKKALAKCINIARETTLWALIVNEPGLSPQILESIYPDVTFFWGLHSKNLCIITNMANWTCWFNSAEYDIIILKCAALKDTCFLTGTYYNPSMTHVDYRHQTYEIHDKLYKFKSCRIIIGGDMNCKSPLWHANESDAKGQVILDSFTHMNLCSAFCPTNSNCRYNKTTGERTWIDSICVDVKLRQLIRSYKFTHLSDSDHDLHTVIFDTLHSSKRIISKQSLVKYFKQEKWDFLSELWMGPLDAENRVHKLECTLKEALDAAIIQTYPTKKKIHIPRCLVKRRRKLEKQLRMAHKRRKQDKEITTIVESIKDNQNLIRNFKKLARTQKFNRVVKEKGVWHVIKRFLGSNLFERLNSVDLFTKSNDIDHSQISSSFTQDDVVCETLFEIPDTSIISHNWECMLEDVKRMLRSKKAIFKDHLSCYIFSILMDVAGEKLIQFASMCLTKGFTPRNIKVSRTCLIPKSCGTKCRPLSIMHPLYRIFDFMIFNYIKNKLDNNILLHHQYGFLPEVGIADYITSLARHIDGIHTKIPICVITIDLSDAFENISMDGIVYGLQKANLNHRDIMLVIQHISNRNSFLKTTEGTKWKFHKKGTPQGSFLSPLLFALSSVVLSHLNENKFRFFNYADDICIIATGDVTRKNKWVLCESKLLLLADTLRLFGLQMNQAKTKIMMLHNGSRLCCNRYLTVGEEKIKWDNSIKILGLTFNNTFRKSSKKRLNIDDVLQDKLLSFEQTIKSNSTGFRGLRLRWAHIALTAFIRGRIEYYGFPMRLFMDHERYKQALDMSQRIIGRIVKTALDLKRKTDHQTLYFLTFQRCLENMIEKKLFDHLFKFKRRNATSWYPDIREQKMDHHILSGFPLPTWGNSNCKATCTKQKINPDIIISQITRRKCTLISISHVQKKVHREYNYLAIIRIGIDEICDALFLFLRDEMDISGEETIIVGCEQKFVNFLIKPAYRTQLNCFLDGLEINMVISTLWRDKSKISDNYDHELIPTRIVFNSKIYHKYMDHKIHDQIRKSSNNFTIRGLHTYAFEQIDWKYLQRKDLYAISMLSGTWHSIKDINGTCPLCGMQFNTIGFFTNPCEHINALTQVRLTEDNFINHFSSLYKIRFLAGILMKCIRFTMDHSQIQSTN